jgi:hypothetical protein
VREDDAGAPSIVGQGAACSEALGVERPTTVSLEHAVSITALLQDGIAPAEQVVWQREGAVVEERHRFRSADGKSMYIRAVAAQN